MSFDRIELEAILSRLEAQPGSPTRLQDLLDSFYKKASQDILIGFFFDQKDLNKISRNQRAFLLRATGLAQNYFGKPPGTAHLGLAPILTGHFDRRLRLIEETLREYGLSPLEVQSWIRFEERFRAMLVR